jgi:SAM-dependent methyltransferase
MTPRDDFARAQELYDRYARQYQERINNDSKLLGMRDLVYQLVSPVRDRRVLCIGCGDGTECVPYAEQGAQVVGIDASNEFIAYAQEHYGPLGIEFFVMDYENTSFADGRFDAIVSIMSIGYKPDLTKVLLELKRIVRAGGVMVIVVPHPVRKMIKYANFDYFLSGLRTEICEGVERFNYYHTIEAYYNLIKASGLVIESILEPKPQLREPVQVVNHVREDLYPHALVFVLNKP